MKEEKSYMEKGEGRSKILIFGGTGHILGTKMVKASLEMGHLTYIYTRPFKLIPNNNNNTNNNGCALEDKLKTLQEFKAMGVTIVQGELDEHEKLVATLRQVEIVISLMGIPVYLEQLKIIRAMKEAGNIKRFIPSEFGNEVDKITALPPFQAFLDNKKTIRRATEAAGIPYTYVSSNTAANYFVYYFLFRPEAFNNQQVTIYGTGETKAVWNYEEDIAAYTIRAATDPRTLNKIMICRLPQNIASQLDVISYWETKTGQILNKIHMPEHQVINLTQSLPHPANAPLAVIHNIFIKGDQMSFEVEEDYYVEASALYPDYKYTSIYQLLDICLARPPTNVKLVSFV